MIPNAFAAILWLAVATSAGVYLWRLYRHVVHHETRHDRAARRQAQDGELPDDPPARPTPSPAIPTVGPSASESKPRRRKAPSEPAESFEDGSLVREVIRQELAKKEAEAAGATPIGPAGDESPSAPVGGGRTGMFAKPQLSVAELLAGVALPCDLAPLVDRDEIDPNRAVFATSGHTPVTVARAMADELERLGFRIDTVDDASAVARKPEGDLHLTIHDDLAAFPNAPRGGVVVELTS